MIIEKTTSARQQRGTCGQWFQRKKSSGWRAIARPLQSKMAMDEPTTRDEVAHGPKRVRLGDAAQGPARPRVVHVLAASDGPAERRT